MACKMTTALVAALVISLASHTVLAQQDQLCSSNPNAFVAPSVDLRAFAAAPWFTQELLPIASLAPPSLFCVRTSFEPLVPENLSVGLIATTTAAADGPSGGLLTVDVFNVPGTDKAPSVSAFQGPADQQAKLNTALQQAATAGQVVLFPIPGRASDVASGRMGAAAAQKLLTTTMDPSQLTPIWVAALGQRPVNISTSQPTPNTTYSWAILLSGTPILSSPCGCTYPLKTDTNAPVSPLPNPIKSSSPSPVSQTPNPPLPEASPTTPPPSPLPLIDISVVVPGNRSSGNNAGSDALPVNNTIVQVSIVERNTSGPLSELRQRTSATIDSLVEKAQDLATKIQEQARETHQRIQDKIQEVQQNIQNKVQEIHQRIAGALDRLFGRDSQPPQPPTDRGHRRLLQTPTVAPAPIPANTSSPTECVVATTDSGCGCNTTCSASLRTWPTIMLRQGGIWIMTREASDADSVAEARRVASEVLGIDITGLVTVCQEGCWEPRKR